MFDNFKDKLNALPPSLKFWNKTVFDNIEKNIKDARDRLEFLHSPHPNEASLHAIKEEEANLDDWLHKNDIKWAHKSRVN